MELALFCDHGGPSCPLILSPHPFHILLMAFLWVCTNFSSGFLDLFSWCDPTFCCFYHFQCFSLLSCFCRGPRCVQIGTGVHLPSCHKSEPWEPYRYCPSSARADSPQNLALISLVLLSVFFFPSIFGPFVFSESVCFMNFLLLIDSMITPFMTYVISNSPELPLSLHFYIGCSISSTQSKRESLPDFIFRIIFITTE